MASTLVTEQGQPPPGLFIDTRGDGEVVVSRRGHVPAFLLYVSLAPVLTLLMAHQWWSAAVVVVATVVSARWPRKPRPVMSIVGDQLRVGRVRIDRRELTAVEVVGSLDRELHLHVAGKRVRVNLTRPHAEYVARWLTAWMGRPQPPPPGGYWLTE